MRLWAWKAKKVIVSQKFWSNLFAPAGLYATILTLAEHFGYGEKFANLNSYWYVLPVFSVCLSIFLSIPKASASIRMAHLDTEVEVKIGDIFDSKAPMLFGVPTTFDHDVASGLVSSRSLQGLFSMKYYRSDDEMRKDLEAATQHLDGYTDLAEAEKPYGPRRKFPPGEVAVLRSKSRLGYAVALASYNKHKVCQITFDEFTSGLPAMWLGIRDRGEIGPVDIPLLGGGYSRLNLTKKQIFKEIIRSFVAACSEGRIASKLTVYVSPQDFDQGAFTMSFIERTLETLCLDGESVGAVQVGAVGTALGAPSVPR